MRRTLAACVISFGAACGAPVDPPAGGPGDDAATLPSPDAPAPAPDAAGLSPTALCPVDEMTAIYPGALPPNPYGDLPDASACVTGVHDAIVLLGCPSNDDGTPSACQTARADIAVALSAAGYGDRFITSGAAVHNDHVEADALAALLVERGVPADRILEDTLAEHTDENLYYASQIMAAQGWTTALVVSDDPGHLVMTAVCDANCCVDLGRLTVVELAVAGRTQVAGHYVLVPPGAAVSAAECAQIEQPLKFMCTNADSRRACADDLQL